MESSLIVCAFQDLPCRVRTIHISFHPGIIYARVLHGGTKSSEGCHDDLQLTQSGKKTFVSSQVWHLGASPLSHRGPCQR